MKEHIHSRIAKILVVLALAVVASVMFVFVGCSSECAHENTHEVTLATATCTSEGTVQTVCDDCNEVIKTEHPAALGHDWDEGTVVAATCTAGGYTLQTCSRCEATRQINPTEALEHQWKDTTVVAATCTAGGYTLQTCELCGATRETNPTEALGHTWETISQAATCGEAGYTAQKCSVCGAIQGMQTIPATGNHTWVAGKTVAATCVTDGYTEYTCSVCGATKQEITQKATGHKWVNDKVLEVAPTCTEDGYYYLECANCDERQTLDVIEATGHSFVYDAEDTVITAATCTEDGSITAKCHCGEVVTYTPDDLAKMTEEQFNKLAIPAAVQEEYDDGAGFLVAAGHNYISVLQQEGYADTAHKYDVPSAGGHDDTLYHVCQDMSVLNEKYTGYSLVCTKCDLKVETADHTPDVTPAYDCVAKEEGSDVAWTCTVCGYDQKVVDHTFVLKSQAADGSWTAEPKADPDGVIAYNCLNAQVCEVCNYTQANGPHKMPAESNTAYQANCQHGMLCETCGKDVFGGKKPHTIVKLEAGETVHGVEAVAATCTTEGLDVYYCETCAALEADEEYPFDVVWTTLTNEQAEELKLGESDSVSTTLGNFYTVVTEKTDHAWVASKISDNKDDPKATLCTTDYWYIDHCSECEATRIETTAEALTGNRKGTGNDSKYVTNSDGWYDPHAGNANGHNYTVDYNLDTYLNEDGTKKEGMEQFALPNCMSSGWFLQTCTNTTDDEGTKCGLRTWVEVTLEEYAAELKTTAEKLLADPDFHVGTMPACGHPVCDVCEPDETAIHTAQYTLTFQVIADASVPEGATLPTYEKFIGWSCYEEQADVNRLTAYLETVDKGAYTIQFYQKYDASTGAFSDEIANWEDLLILDGDDTYRQNTTIYVKASLNTEDLGTAPSYFQIDGYIASWGTDGDLEIGWSLDNTVIPYTSITSITVELKNGDGASCTKAVSTGDQLAAYIEACEPYWAADAERLAYSIDGFTTATGAQTCWTYTNTTAINATDNADLTGYTLTVTIACGDATFIANATL